MDFFKVTNEDIEKAKTGDKATFKDKELATFTIREFKEKVVNDKQTLIVECVVSSENTENNGKGHAFFINDSAFAVKTWVKILQCFYTDEQIAQGIDPMTMVSLKFKSTANHSQNGDKLYVNFYEFANAELDVDVTDMPPIVPVDAVKEDDLPF